MSAKDVDVRLRRLAEKHREYDRRLGELSRRRFPTVEERIEEVLLKKLKLRTKDDMQTLLRSAAGVTGRHG